MAVEIIGTPIAIDSGEYYTPETLGHNKLIVITLCQEPVSAGSGSVSSITLGGVAMTEAVYINASGHRGLSAIYYIKEEDAPSGSSQLLITYSGTFNSVSVGTAFTFKNVDQATPFHYTGTDEESGTAVPSISYTKYDQGYVIGAGTIDTGGIVQSDSSPWVQYNNSLGSASAYRGLVDAASLTTLFSNSWDPTSSVSQNWTQAIGIIQETGNSYVDIKGTPYEGDTGDSYTAESGNDRLLVFIAGTENDFASITDIDFGSVTATLANGSISTGTGRALTTIRYIKEADIPTGSQTITVTGTGFGIGSAVTALTLIGVDQKNPIFDSKTQELSSTALSVTLPTLSTIIESVAIGVGVCASGSGGAMVGPTGWTEMQDVAVASGRYEDDYIYTSGTSLTPTWTRINGKWSATGVAFNPVQLIKRNYLKYISGNSIVTESGFGKKYLYNNKVITQTNTEQIIPLEGITNILERIYKNDTTDRGTSLAIGLFTSDDLDKNSIWDSGNGVNQPTSGGYAEKTLTDINWSISNGVASYAEQIWEPSGNIYIGVVLGYYIRTTGATPRLLVVQYNTSGTIVELDHVYKVTPKINLSDGIPGVTHDEGIQLTLEEYFKQNNGDHTGTVLLELYTNTGAITTSTAKSSMTFPTIDVGGYTSFTILSTDWTISNGTISAPTKVFNANGSWSASVYGYAIYTITGTAQRLMHTEPSIEAPITMTDEDSHEVGINIVVK